MAIGSIARSFSASSATGWPRPHPPRRRSRAPSAKKKSGESLFRGGAIFRRRPFCYLKGGGAISWSRPCPPQRRSWARIRARRYLEAALFFGVGPFLSLPQRNFGHASFSSEQYFIGNGSNTGNSDEITTVKTRIDI